MVTRALHYVGDVMKHIKPLLLSKNQEGLQRVYWTVGQLHGACHSKTSRGASDFFFQNQTSERCHCSVLFEPGCIVKHWSPLLATSKAQQLLFRIVDGLLLPHSLTQQDKALRDSLPLYLQVREHAASQTHRTIKDARGAHVCNLLTFPL